MLKSFIFLMTFSLSVTISLLQFYNFAVYFETTVLGKSTHAPNIILIFCKYNVIFILLYLPGGFMFLFMNCPSVCLVMLLDLLWYLYSYISLLLVSSWLVYLFPFFNFQSFFVFTLKKCAPWKQHIVRFLKICINVVSSLFRTIPNDPHLLYSSISVSSPWVCSETNSPLMNSNDQPCSEVILHIIQMYL